MKTRINKIFSTNSAKLKNIIFNRYNLDKRDRKSLNNVKNTKESNIEYLYIADAKKDEILNILINNSSSIKMKGMVDGVYNEMIIPPTMFNNDSTEAVNALNAIAINLSIVYNIPMMNFNGTLYEYINLAMSGFDEYYKSLPKITKEEYYSF